MEASLQADRYLVMVLDGHVWGARRRRAMGWLHRRRDVNGGVVGLSPRISHRRSVSLT